jgi:serine/threonine protein kinase/aspartate 1-decarboxylase
MLRAGIIISNRYEIIDLVGSGGMADVYKAKDRKLNRFVAIKVLKSEYASDANFVKKFRVEAQSAGGLSHPNVVNVYDVGEDNGLHYIVMELVEGITLKRFIEKKGRLDVKEAVVVAIQIAQGMEAAHNNHIIHRDIKPQNIIISREGKVKVTDFGIAKATNSNTITSNAMGSVHYLSPEQARGGYSDEKSDIYSLGVTIYEMLSGKVPFAGDNNVSIALLHIQAEATPLRSLDPSIPVSVDKIVQKCMQKKPERRYHSASELISDLKKAISNPDGNYVQIPAFVPSDSPTINMSDDINKIKNGAMRSDQMYDTGTNRMYDTRGNTSYNTSYDTRSMQPYNPRNNEDNPEEDEELDTVDSKIDKFVVAGSIITIAILFLAIVFIVALFLFPKNKKNPTDNNKPSVALTPSVSASPTAGADKETFIVPSVVNLTEEDAKNTIKEQNPAAVIDIKYGYSEDVTKGVVMNQDPKEETECPVTSKITLEVSQGLKPSSMPDVTGYKQKAATDTLADDYGLRVATQSEASDTVKAGLVIRTKPAAGTAVNKGDSVILVVSKGAEEKTAQVPTLLNKTKAEAQQLLARANLQLGNVSTEPSDRIQKGRITYQDTSSGETVPFGTRISIKISTGPQKKLSYVGSVTIDSNPFDSDEYSGEDSVDVELEMNQDGVNSPIYSGTLTSDRFPLYQGGIKGNSASKGIVTMYVNGEPYIAPGESKPKTWTVNFSTVEE